MLKINGANIRKVEVPSIAIENQISILSHMSQFTSMLVSGEKRLSSLRKFQGHLANAAIAGQ